MISVEKIASLQAHSGSLYALSLGRSSGTLFSAGADNVVAEWDLKTHQPNKFAIRTERTVYSLLNLDRKHLLIGTIVGGMHVIDLESRLEVRHLKLHDKGLFHLIHIQSKNLVCAASADGSVSVWDSREWSLTQHLKLSHEKIRRLSLNDDETLLAVACGDGNIHLIETETFRPVEVLAAHDNGSNSLVFLPNGDLISGGKDAYIRRWNASNGFQELASVPAHNYAIYDIVNLGESGLIASVSRDKTVKIWDPLNLENPTRLDRAKSGGHINSVNAALWLKDEKLLATCSDDRSVILWKIHF